MTADKTTYPCIQPITNESASEVTDSTARSVCVRVGVLEAIFSIFFSSFGKQSGESHLADWQMCMRTIVYNAPVVWDRICTWGFVSMVQDTKTLDTW